MPTPNYGWPIPALTDPPDGPGQIGALGNAIDATLKAQIRDTGLITVAGTFATNWGTAGSPITGRRVGDMCWLRVMATRITVASAAPSVTGDINPDMPIYYITDPLFIPALEWCVMPFINGTFGGLGHVGINGTVSLAQSTGGTAVIGIGTGWIGTCSYPAKNPWP